VAPKSRSQLVWLTVHPKTTARYIAAAHALGFHAEIGCRSIYKSANKFTAEHSITPMANVIAIVMAAHLQPGPRPASYDMHSIDDMAGFEGTFFDASLVANMDDDMMLFVIEKDPTMVSHPDSRSYYHCKKELLSVSYCPL